MISQSKPSSVAFGANPVLISCPLLRQAARKGTQGRDEASIASLAQTLAGVHRRHAEDLGIQGEDSDGVKCTSGKEPRPCRASRGSC
jgi:hypothetical protein